MKTNYIVKTDKNQFEINSKELDDLDIIPLKDGGFHLVKEGKNFHFFIDLERSDSRQEVGIKVNGDKHILKVEDELDQLIDAIGMNTHKTSIDNDILAPMPGLVLDILVGEGEKVEVGEPLIILEAMKMENVIKATSQSVIGQINVVKKEAVTKGQLLIKIQEAE